MKVSVVTPSLNQSDWLRLCVASVADQRVDVEHLVQDGGSTDGTLDWLVGDPRVSVVTEPDTGMYDAVNRGLVRAGGDVLAYLNCDEQYLPGTLERVVEFFDAEPDVDILFGDVVVVDAECDYLFHRKMLTPLRTHTWLCQLSTLTCAMFFRRRVFFDRDGLFDARCPVADAEWVLRMIESKTRMAALGEFLSVFGDTGENLSLRIQHEGSSMASWRPPPYWMSPLKPLVVAHHRLRRLAGGAYNTDPFTFSVYSPSQLHERVERVVEDPTFRWGSW